MDTVPNEYVVTIKNHYDDDAFTTIMTAPEIFDRMDIDDCSGEYISDLRLVRPYNKNNLVRAEFHGSWHDFKNPLLMTITVRGKVIDHGYGTDH